jgi:hypothetical protein
MGRLKKITAEDIKKALAYWLVKHRNMIMAQENCNEAVDRVMGEWKGK